jgi:hypothetical protein
MKIDSFIVDGVEIPFDPTWNKISISLSGGADSALLAYLLCDNIWTNDLEHIEVHVISHARMWKTKPWQQYDSLKIYNWLCQRFVKIKFQRHTNFIAPDLEYGDQGPIILDEYGKLVSGDNAQIRAFAEYTCFKNNIPSYYNAVTRNPRNVDFQGMTERNIEPTDTNQHLYLMQHMNGWAIHPFRFIEKSWIYKQYKILNILDLWDRTRSCEGTFDNIDYKNYIPYKTVVPECGICFWCKERNWSKDANN